MLIQELTEMLQDQTHIYIQRERERERERERKREICQVKYF